MSTRELPQPRPGAPRRCPDCGAPLSTAARACPRCGLSLVGPTAQRLWWIDAELDSLRGRERSLLKERPGVLDRLRWESRTRVPPPVPGYPARLPARPAAETHQAAPVPPAPPGKSGGEVSQRSAQNVILGLGGLLVSVAALVFAIWAWSDMGTGARAAVLVLTTLAFAGLAHPLYRRGLRATAETFGALAAGLLCVDALALWILAAPITNGPAYAAAALAVMSTFLVLYPALVPLRSPRILAALFAQPVPVLSVAALPIGPNPGWLVTVLAATALADALIVRRLGAPRERVPVRTLHVSSLVLWGLSLALTSVALLVTGAEAGGQPGWWSLTATLFVAGATGLLLERWRRPATASPDHLTAYTVIGLGALALMPLAAGPPHLPVLPRLPVPPWSLDPAAMTTPAAELLQLDRAGTVAPLNTVYLAGILVAAGLAVGAVLLLRRSALLVALSLLAPATLLALPILLGMPQVVAVVWALVVGGGLVLGAAVLRAGTGAVAVLTGTLTLLIGLVWALPERYTTLAALLLLSVTALLCAAGARRFTDPVHRPRPGDRSAALYAGGVLLWGLTLLFGISYLIGNRGAEGTVQAQWWLLSAVVLLCGATALMLGRVRRPPATGVSAVGHGPAAGGRTVFTLAGLALLPTAPLLALPAATPALTLVPPHDPWSAPVETVRAPVHAVLGLPAQPDALYAVGSALGVLLAGALVIALVSVIDRRWLPAGFALAVPLTLVPLPVLLGAPFLSALVWTLAVGALLMTGAALLREPRLSWMPWASGLLTLLLALSWSLPERYSTVGVLMAVALVASVTGALARTRFVAVAATSVSTAATGAFALTLLLALDAPVEYAAFGPIAVAAAVAAVAPRLRGPLLEAAEVPAAAWAALALLLTVLSGTRLELVALALAVVGVVGLATAVRPHRRWVAAAGALLMFAALWTVLASWNVTAPEAYTVPPATAFLVVGWEWSRRAAPAPPSWLAYGGGLALLVGPTLWLVLMAADTLWRVPALIAAGVAITVWGLRQRLRAALVVGGLTLLLTSLRAFGPPLWELARMMPNWVPFAAVGLLLLFVGARYEASLARLRRVGRLLRETR